MEKIRFGLIIMVLFFLIGGCQTAELQMVFGEGINEDGRLIGQGNRFRPNHEFFIYFSSLKVLQTGPLSLTIYNLENDPKTVFREEFYPTLGREWDHWFIPITLPQGEYRVHADFGDDLERSRDVTIGF